MNILFPAIKTNSTPWREISRDSRGLSLMATHMGDRDSQPGCGLTLMPPSLRGLQPAENSMAPGSTECVQKP